MLFRKDNKIKSAWKLTIPEKFGIEPYFIKTSPVVLGCSMECDVVIRDPSVSESHLQFILIRDGKYLEIYDIAGSNSDGENEDKNLSSRRSSAASRYSKTLLDGQTINGKIRLEADKNQNFTLKAGDVYLSLTYAAVIEQAHPKKSYTVRDKDIEWFYLHDGVEYGPAKFPELFKAIRDGVLLPLDDAWHSGLTNRIKAFEIPDLFTEKSRIPETVGATDSNKHICPYCWHGFKSEDLLYIARHPSLMGDPVLGYDEQQRFLPRIIKPSRKALDSRGELCSDMACPRCHLRIPTPFLDTAPLFFSIIGSPGSGKSYYLATSTWRLRRVLPEYFGLNFEDIDNITNQWINSYEEKLFLPARGVDYNTIEKTQIESTHTAKEVKINAVSMFLPLPAIFSLLSNKKYHSSQNIQNTLAFYDNAGEHFQTGQDIIQRPGSLHMLRANGYLFLFDPTADPRFTRIINISLRDKLIQTVSQQQKILIETIDRLRKHTGLNVRDKIHKPVVIAISKADLLTDYFSKEMVRLDALPYRFIKSSNKDKLERSNGKVNLNKNSSLADIDSQNQIGVLDVSHINRISAFVREIFCKLTPEFVNTIETIAENVIYLPVSAIGHQPDSKGVHPKDIHPLWIEVPFLYILSKMGYIPYITP